MTTNATMEATTTSDFPTEVSYTSVQDIFLGHINTSRAYPGNDSLTGGGRPSNFGNSRGGYYYNPTQWQIFISYSPIMSLGLIGMILNLIALIALYKVTKKDKNSSDIFLIWLLTFDLGASVLAFLWALAKAVMPRVFPSVIYMELVCRLWYSKFLLLLLSDMSLFNCVLLTLERYGKIVFPIMHRNWMTNQKAYIILAVLFLYNIIVGVIVEVIPTSIYGGRCDVDYSNPLASRMGNQMYTLVTEIIIPVVSFILCYSHMLAVLQRRHLKVKPSSNCQTQQGKEEAGNNSNKKLAFVEIAGNLSTIPETNSLGTNRTETTHIQELTTHNSNTLAVDDVDDDASTATSISKFQADQPDKNTTAKQQKKTKQSTRGKAKKQSKFAQAERNILVAAILVNVSFIICNVPIRIYFILGLSGAIVEEYRSPEFSAMTTLIYLNFCLHPIIYAFTLKKLRDKIMFKKKP